MAITFSAEVEDVKRIKHVSVRSRRQPEVELPAMPSAEEIERWRNREMKYCSRNMGWRPNYDDGVEARRDAEKASRNERARRRLATNPVTLLEDLAAVQVRGERICTSDQKILAEVVRAAPQELHWSHTISKMPAATLLNIARQCRDSEDPVFAWNLHVRLNNPRYPSPTKIHMDPLYCEPERRGVHALGSVSFVPKSNKKAEVEEWMRAAEENRLPNRSTRCSITGRSLVSKTRHFGRHSWQVLPDFNGMSVEAAQQVASAAAIRAGMVRGVVRGEPPPIVQELLDNTGAWLGLVIATRHPVFYQTAVQLLKMNGKEFRITEDQEANRRAWAEITTEVRSGA